MIVDLSYGFDSEVRKAKINQMFTSWIIEFPFQESTFFVTDTGAVMQLHFHLHHAIQYYSIPALK